MGAAAGVVADAYGVSLGSIGFLVTALFATHLALQIPGGRLVDRRGARIVAMGGLAVIAVGNLLALLLASYAAGVAGRLIAGLGTGIGFIAGSDYVRSTVGTAGAQGLYGAAAVGGGGVAIAVVPLTTSALGWRAPYLTALICACAVLVCLPLAPRERPRRRLRRSERSSLVDIARDRRLYPLGVAHTASFAFSVIAGNWAVSLLEHDGYGRRLAGLVAALTLLGGLVTRPLGGTMVQRRPARAAPLLVLSMLAGAAGAVLLLLDAPLLVRVAGAAVLGLAAGIPFAPAFTGAQLIRPDAPASAIGFINTSATFVIVVGTPLVGLTFALPGHGRAGFAVMAALWALASLIVVRARIPAPRGAT